MAKEASVAALSRPYPIYCSIVRIPALLKDPLLRRLRQAIDEADDGFQRRCESLEVRESFYGQIQKLFGGKACQPRRGGIQQWILCLTLLSRTLDNITFVYSRSHLVLEQMGRACRNTEEASVSSSSIW